MNTHIEEKAYAKLNLSLDVVSKMPDGYHDLKMIFQSVSLHDSVEIDINDSGKISVMSNLGYLPGDASNIAARAAKAFFDVIGSDCGAEIRLYKRIPICAGMGGGSADGAAVLRALNRHFDYPLDTEKLISIGRDIGSDVPFCIIGGTVLASGRGDVMTELPPIPDCDIVICKPQFSISTPTLFKRIDCRKIRFRPDTDGLVSSIEAGELREIARRVFNVFEDVLTKERDGIEHIKSALHQQGAVGAAMTGTGSAVFGIFDSRERAERAYNELSGQYRECFITKPVKKFEQHV